MKYYSYIILFFCLSSSVYAGWRDNFEERTKKISYKNMGDIVIKKMEDTLTNLHSSLVELNKAGFRADEVWISSSSTITVVFKDTGKTGEEKQVLKDNKDKKILYLTLKLLLKTREFSIAHYKIRNLEVELSFPPKLVLQTSIDGL